MSRSEAAGATMPDLPSEVCEERERVALPLRPTLRQQCRAGDARLRVGLHDAGDRRGDIEIGGARLLDDARSVPASGISRHQSSGGRAACRHRRIARAAVIGRRNIEPGLGLVAGEQAAAERQHQADRGVMVTNGRACRFVPALHDLATATHTDNFQKRTETRLGPEISLNSIAGCSRVCGPAASRPTRGGRPATFSPPRPRIRPG